MGRTGVDPQIDAKLQRALGWTFVERSLLEQALTHRSYCSEHGIEASNERLEFLGDSVLGFVVTTFVYEEFPGLPEGELAKLRASVVSAEALAEIATELDLGPSLLLGKGEDASGGRAKPSILSDAMEAVIAAVYLDGGIEPASALVLHALECTDPRTGHGTRRPATTRPASRSSRRNASTSSRGTRSATKGRTTRSTSSRPYCCATRSTARVKDAPRRQPSKRQLGLRGIGCRARRMAPPRAGGTDSEREMPELPEVEVVRRDLDREIVGKKIKSVEVDGMRAVRRHHNRKQFTSRLIDRKIVGVDRRGKYLLCRLDGDDVLVIHLGMSGQLLRAKSSRDATAKHTHVVITFTQGGQLRFVDPRTFGEMFVTELDTVEQEVTELAHLGIDPLEAAMSWEHFGQMLNQRPSKLKPLLMDQKFIAGIGNIYSDEILWGAGLRWDRMSNSLTSEEVRRLYRSMMETLQEAVKHRGSSLSDGQYVDLFGRPGEYQHFHSVYAREGLSCPRCRHEVVRERFAGRSTFYCSACQV